MGRSLRDKGGIPRGGARAREVLSRPIAMDGTPRLSLSSPPMSPSPARIVRGRAAGIAALALVLLACGADRPHRRARRPPLVPVAIGRPVVDWVRAGGGERIVVGEGG